MQIKGRRLKKVLSLVLCVAMMLSVMVMSTGATSFSDEDEFSPQYKEAAEVLTGMGVMQGYENGSYFLPQRNITRAQVATLIYRAATSDVEDTQTGLFTDWDQFDDVHADDWFAGYVNYCGNAELIKGFTPDTFGPLKNVTGYQVLAMILRAIGYDANDEFTGEGWEVRTATTAKEIGLLDNVQDTTLGVAASRELVAELIFQAMNVDMVEYNLIVKDYVPVADKYGNETLGEREFDLTNLGDDHDVWGRPGTLWTYEAGETMVMEDALATYETAVTECDVADDLGFDGTKTFTTYTNGEGNAKDYKVQATDTVGTIGEQGRITEVYEDEIVYIDTYLAEVTDVVDATFDKANHLKDSSKMTLRVYTGEGTNQYEDVNLFGGKTDYDYTEGQYLLVQAVDEPQKDGSDGPIAQSEGTYGETPDTLKILQVAESFIGAQDTIWASADEHKVDGTVYDDAYTFYLNETTKDTSDRIWFMDQFDNLIGTVEQELSTDYAILTGMKWVVGDPGYAEATLQYIDGTTGTVKVNSMAGVDGNDDTIPWTTPSILADSTTWKTYEPTYIANNVHLNDGTAYMSNDTKYNDMYQGYALYEVKGNTDGTVDLTATNYLHANDSQVVTGGTTLSTYYINGWNLLNDDTVYVVRQATDDGYTYERYVGNDNVPTFVAGTAQVFYLKGNDDVVDFVYIQNGTVKGSGSALVAATDEQVIEGLYNGKELWGLADAQVNGVDVDNSVLSENAGVITGMADSVNQLFLVTYGDDGYVDSAEYIDFTGKSYNDGTVRKLFGDTIYTGGTLQEYNKTWDISSVPVYGDYTDDAQLTDVDFDEVYAYIVLDEDGKAVALYVYDIPEGAQPSEDPADPALTWTAESKTHADYEWAWITVGEEGYIYTADETVTLKEVFEDHNNNDFGATIEAVYYETDSNGLVTKVTLDKNSDVTIASILDAVEGEITLTRPNDGTGTTTWHIINQK